MSNTVDYELIRTLGNELMAEFDYVFVLFERALVCAKNDSNTEGENSRTSGINKYSQISEIRDFLPKLRADYLNFCALLGFDSGNANWAFPFDEQFAVVDIEMDNRVVDQFFEENVRNLGNALRAADANARKYYEEALMNRFFRCPCCARTFFEKNGDYNICPDCGWENDSLQNNNTHYKGGANNLSLDEARQKYRARFITPFKN